MPFHPCGAFLRHMGQRGVAKCAAGAFVRSPSRCPSAALCAPLSRPNVRHYTNEGSTHPRIGVAALLKDKEKDYTLPHPIYTPEELAAVKFTHRPCVTASDKLAYSIIRAMRLCFDIGSGYYLGKMTESRWLTRIILLESVAGVPGMVGAMCRHLHSLRSLQRDHGFIHTLLEEAENERMHLLTALELRKPGKLFRLGLVATQGVMTNILFVSYLFFPKFVHRLVGHLEEEAVATYTRILDEIAQGNLPLWVSTPAPPIAVKYWKLAEDSKVHDVIKAIRADESHHRDVNHAFASLPANTQNPFGPGE